MESKVARHSWAACFQLIFCQLPFRDIHKFADSCPCPFVVIEVILSNPSGFPAFVITLPRRLAAFPFSISTAFNLTMSYLPGGQGVLVESSTIITGITGNL